MALGRVVIAIGRSSGNLCVHIRPYILIVAWLSLIALPCLGNCLKADRDGSTSVSAPANSGKFLRPQPALAVAEDTSNASSAPSLGGSTQALLHAIVPIPAFGTLSDNVCNRQVALYGEQHCTPFIAREPPRL